jgi:hypothetical protein
MDKPKLKVVDPAEDEMEGPLKNMMGCVVTDEYCNSLGDEQWYFPDLIIKNQIAVIIAKSGGGKTTIIYNFVCPWMLKNFPDLEIFFLDCDSPASDHKSMKAKADEMGSRFMWINPVTKGKSADFIIEMLKEISKSRTNLKNKVFIFDTLKKYTNLMSKQSTKPFYGLLRELISLGATIILLGHANKYRDSGGNLVFEGVGDVLSDTDALIFFEIIPTAGSGQNITTIVDPDKGAKVRGLYDQLSFHISLPDREVTQHEEVIPVPNWGATPTKLSGDEIVKIIQEKLNSQNDWLSQTELVNSLRGQVPYNALIRTLKAVAIPESEATLDGQIVFVVGVKNSKKYTVKNSVF